MDLICCALGGVIVLMLIFSSLVENGLASAIADTPTSNSQASYDAVLAKEKQVNFIVQIETQAPEGVANNLTLISHVDSNSKAKVEITEVSIENGNHVDDARWRRFFCKVDAKEAQHISVYNFSINNPDSTAEYKCNIRLMADRLLESDTLNFTSNLDFKVKKLMNAFNLRY